MNLKKDMSMPTKRKPRAKVVHICTKKKLLDRIVLVLFGDGTPEEGLSFMFREFMRDHTRVVNDITEIKGKVIEAIESSGKAIHAVETYKAEMQGVEIGEGKNTAKKKLKFDSVISIVGTVVIVLTLLLSFWQEHKDNKKTNLKIDNVSQQEKLR